jgi:cytochrome c
MAGLDPGLRWDGHGEQRVHDCESAVRRPIGEDGLAAIPSRRARKECESRSGKTKFMICAIGHSAEAGKNKVGPSLFSIVGHKSGSVAGYNYSDAMKNFNQAWTRETLDAYLANPSAVVPGTKMIFPGIKDRAERANLIGYLERLK